jgi:hypothetical protein
VPASDRARPPIDRLEIETAGYTDVMLTIVLIVLLVLLLTGGIGYSRRGRRL